MAVDHSIAVFAGCDVSENHGAMVFRGIDGRLIGMTVLVDKVKWAAPIMAAFPGKSWVFNMAASVPKPTPENAETVECARLDVLDRWTRQSIRGLGVHTQASGMPPLRVVYCAIEEAALSRGGLYDLGQAAGAVKVALWGERVSLRGHDPKTVKKYATGAGDASKEDVARTLAESEWQPIDYRPLIDGRYPPGEDLADADALCRMARTEYRLRHGLDDPKALPSHQVEAFLRVTRNRQVNVLAREWASKAGAEAMLERQTGGRRGR